MGLISSNMRYGDVLTTVLAMLLFSSWLTADNVEIGI